MIIVNRLKMTLSGEMKLNNLAKYLKLLITKTQKRRIGQARGPSDRLRPEPGPARPDRLRPEPDRASGSGRACDL